VKLRQIGKKEKDKLNLQRKVAPNTKSGQHAASAKPLAKPKKEKSSSASASSASKSSSAKASTAKASTAKAHSAAEIDSHVELGQIRARFSQLHSQAYHYRELATSHFSHVSTSLAQGDRLSAASWIELFDAAVSKAHEASSAATALSKKIVRHAVGVVTKRRESFLVARKARRIALHELTKARALLSRGFYDKKMGYPANISTLRAAVDKCRARFRQSEDNYAQAIVSLSNSRAHLVKRNVDMQQSRSLYENELELLQKSSHIRRQLAAPVSLSQVEN